MNITKKMSAILTFIILCQVGFFCAHKKTTSKESQNLIIFHAGSLSIPFKEIAEAFKIEHPNVTIIMEAAGSMTSAQKITNQAKPCDIMASADYTIIKNLLIPDYTEWYINFVSNEMALVFDKGSKRSKEITKDNWFSILLDRNVAFGRSDPNSDPCGYRAILTMKLAEQYYNAVGLTDMMLIKDTQYIRPEETELLALLDSNTIDYIFLYRSVAEQHGLNYLLLPDEINLKKPELSEYYKTASVEISGKIAGTAVVKVGEPMVYGITILKDAPQPTLAEAFVSFVLNKQKGIKILEKNGQPSLVPSKNDTYKFIPESLKHYALSE